MDILDRPENGGLLKALIKRARDMRLQQAHMEALGAQLKIELERYEQRKQLMKNLDELYGPLGGLANLGALQGILG